MNTVRITLPLVHKHYLRKGVPAPAVADDGRVFRLHWMGRTVIQTPGTTSLPLPADALDALLLDGEVCWVPADGDERYEIVIDPQAS